MLHLITAFSKLFSAKENKPSKFDIILAESHNRPVEILLENNFEIITIDKGIISNDAWTKRIQATLEDDDLYQIHYYAKSISIIM